MLKISKLYICSYIKYGYVMVYLHVTVLPLLSSSMGSSATDSSSPAPQEREHTASPSPEAAWQLKLDLVVTLSAHSFHVKRNKNLMEKEWKTSLA